MLSNPDLEQVCVVGSGLPQPMALIVLSAAARMKPESELKESIEQTLTQVNSHLESYEKVECAVV